MAQLGTPELLGFFDMMNHLCIRCFLRNGLEGRDRAMRNTVVLCQPFSPSSPLQIK